MKEILNPNSSGQGEVPSHTDHPLHKTVVEFGYKYSHSVVVKDDCHIDSRLEHCYKLGKHNVSIGERDDGRHILVWDTSCSCASGHSWAGHGEPELRAHLASKKRRYNITARSST